jgi:hypothetical protein
MAGLKIFFRFAKYSLRVAPPYHRGEIKPRVRRERRLSVIKIASRLRPHDERISESDNILPIAAHATWYFSTPERNVFTLFIPRALCQIEVLCGSGDSYPVYHSTGFLTKRLKKDNVLIVTPSDAHVRSTRESPRHASETKAAPPFPAEGTCRRIDQSYLSVCTSV